MNHLGDTNKMVRDTPRMDASAHDDGAIWETGCDIERELNAANQIGRKYEDRYFAALERIKRLEEFARTIENDFDHDEDAHRYGTTCRVCDAEDLLKETKAKEAKL
jgi:ribosomal 50S subunit-associated protein YjgA (DUF615 family)